MNFALSIGPAYSCRSRFLIPIHFLLIITKKKKELHGITKSLYIEFAFDLSHMADSYQ